MKKTIVLLAFLSFTGYTVNAQGYSYPEPKPAFKIPGPDVAAVNAAKDTAHFQQQHQEVQVAAPGPVSFATQQKEVSFTADFSGQTRQPETLTLLVPVQQQQVSSFTNTASAQVSSGQPQYTSSDRTQSTQAFSAATAQQHSAALAPAPALPAFSGNSFQSSVQVSRGQESYSNGGKAQTDVSNSFQQSQVKLTFDQPASVIGSQQQNTFSSSNVFNAPAVIKQQQGGVQKIQGFDQQSQVQQQQIFNFQASNAGQSFEGNRAQNEYGNTAGIAQTSDAVKTSQTFFQAPVPQAAVTINKQITTQQALADHGQFIASVDKSQGSQQVSFNAGVGGPAQQVSSGAKLNYAGSATVQTSGAAFNQGAYSNSGAAFAGGSSSSSSQQQFSSAPSASYIPPPPPSPPAASPPQISFALADRPQVPVQPVGPPAPPPFLPGPVLPPGQAIRPPAPRPTPVPQPLVPSVLPSAPLRPNPAPAPAPFLPSPLPGPASVPPPAPLIPAPAPAPAPFLPSPLPGPAGPAIVPLRPAPAPAPAPFGPTFQGAGANVNEGDYSAIPGEPDTDYPILSSIPSTDFSCSKQQYPGYYADVSTRCQVFHMCWDNRQWSFLCPNGTIFSQEHFVCVWWNDFDCQQAPGLYSKNQELYIVPQPTVQSSPSVQSPQGLGSQGLGVGVNQLNPSLGIQQGYQNQGALGSFASSSGSILTQQASTPALAPVQQITVPVHTPVGAPQAPAPPPVSSSVLSSASGVYQNQAVHSSVASANGNAFTQQTGGPSLVQVSSPQASPVVTNTQGTLNLGQQYLPPPAQQVGSQNAGRPIQQQPGAGSPVLAQEPLIAVNLAVSSPAFGGSQGGSQVNGQNLLQQGPSVGSSATISAPTTAYLPPSSGGVKY